MKIVLLMIPCLMLIFYLGAVLGIMLMCDSMPELRRVKKFARYIPGLEVRFLIHCLFDDTIKDKSRFLISFLRYDEKTMLFAFCMAKCLEELSVRKSSRVEKKQLCMEYVMEHASSEFDRLCLN